MQICVIGLSPSRNKASPKVTGCLVSLTRFRRSRANSSWQVFLCAMPEWCLETVTACVFDSTLFENFIHPSCHGIFGKAIPHGSFSHTLRTSCFIVALIVDTSILDVRTGPNLGRGVALNWGPRRPHLLHPFLLRVAMHNITCH